MKKKVLITGGSGDIAQAIRDALPDEGFDVRTPGKGEMDVTSIDSVKAYIDGFVPDILVNNAGYVLPTSIRHCDVESERKSVEINLFGPFNCAAAVLAENPEAQVINIGSSAATKPHATWSSYCATKAGLVMATECWADDGVNAICISPGRTRTKMRKGLYPDEDQSSLMNPADFARVVVRAIRGDYAPGAHVNVNVDNVKGLIDE